MKESKYDISFDSCLQTQNMKAVLQICVMIKAIAAVKMTYNDICKNRKCQLQYFGNILLSKNKLKTEIQKQQKT